MKILNKIVFSFFTLYSYNIVAANFGKIIPINIYTILLVFLLDIPGLVCLSVTFFSFLQKGCGFVTQENEIRNSYIDFRKHAYILNVDENFEESQIINEIKIAVSNHFDKQMSEKINTLIDSGNYSDLKIVKPIGKSIKKNNYQN